MRGFLQGALDQLHITEHPKQWRVGLTQTHMLWLDGLWDRPFGFDPLAGAKAELGLWKRNVAAQCEKYFVYFLASRTRVRFSERNKPRYSRWRNRLIFWVEIGRNRELRKIEIPIPVGTSDGEPMRVPVTTTPNWITFDTPRGKVTQSVHDFLLNSDVDLGIDTMVRYVGRTKNPDDRVLNRKHAGYTRMLSSVSNEDNDFFLFQHLFKPIVLANFPSHGLNVCAANSILDLTGVKDEVLIIEKALIAYFEPSTQEDNLRCELSEFRNLLDEHRIGKMMLGIDYDQPSGYFRYCGTAISAHDRVGGIYTLESGGLQVARDPTLDLEFVAMTA